MGKKVEKITVDMKAGRLQEDLEVYKGRALLSFQMGLGFHISFLQSGTNIYTERIRSKKISIKHNNCIV